MPHIIKNRIFIAKDGKRAIYILLITKTYKHYGKIYQPLHRFRLQAHIRQGNEQGHFNRVPERPPRRGAYDHGPEDHEQ